jgi:hypothetical protein
MSGNIIDRVFVLCEDQLHERLLRRWLDLRGVRIEDVDRAPAAKGSAASFVARQFPNFVAKAKRKLYQQGVGFIAVIDGDAEGLKRKAMLLALLGDDPKLLAAYQQRVVILVPTWAMDSLCLSVTPRRDSWILSVLGSQLQESEQIGEADKKVAGQNESVKNAAVNFDAYRRQEPAHLLALLDANVELTKVGLD